MSLENIPHCEIFYPTLSEFQNFEDYILKCESLSNSGIIKVVPPKEWTARSSSYDMENFTIKSPIEQIVNGRSGFYELIYIQRESRSLCRYKKLLSPLDKLSENQNLNEVEKKFWRTLKFSSPLYGADAPGTLFDKGVLWNLSELDSTLTRGLKKNIKGVTSPYLYVGSWKTLFAWHKEDMDLYSINYLHWGKPKCWYSIPVKESDKFYDIAKKNFPDAAKECNEFLRHKTYLIYPGILVNNSITVNKCIQNAGEFVITKAGAYHAGFNMGFYNIYLSYNCAEAVNFATKKWIAIGKKAKSCNCTHDSVKINMDCFSKSKIGRKSSLVKKQKKIVKKKIENWMKCELCGKWRKIDGIRIRKTFKCNSILKIDCKTLEEKWKNKYNVIKHSKKHPQNRKNK